MVEREKYDMHIISTPEVSNRYWKMKIFSNISIADLVEIGSKVLTSVHGIVPKDQLLQILRSQDIPEIRDILLNGLSSVADPSSKNTISDKNNGDNGQSIETQKN